MERGEGRVVEGDYRTDGSTRFMDLRLAVQLRLTGVEDAHGV